MPFSLTNAPVTFQLLMNGVLRPFLRRFVLFFFGRHPRLQPRGAIRKDSLGLHAYGAKLFIKRSKCSFGDPSVLYLSHIVS